MHPSFCLAIAPPDRRRPHALPKSCQQCGDSGSCGAGPGGSARSRDSANACAIATADHENLARCGPPGGRRGPPCRAVAGQLSRLRRFPRRARLGRSAASSAPCSERAEACATSEPSISPQTRAPTGSALPVRNSRAYGDMRGRPVRGRTSLHGANGVFVGEPRRRLAHLPCETVRNTARGRRCRPGGRAEAASGSRTCSGSSQRPTNHALEVGGLSRA